MIGPVIALLAAMQAPAAPQPGEVRIFGDWAVGCDNGWACEAISLAPEDWSIGTQAALTVRRAGGEHGYLAVGVRVFEDDPGEVLALHIDGEHAATLTDSDGLLFEAEPAMTRLILPLIADGHRASLRGPAGEHIGELSLAGSAAALRFIDDRQRRSGTRGAAVARGSRPDASVPEPPAIPVYEVPPFPDAAEAEPVPADEAMTIHLAHDCDGIDDELIRNVAYPLPGGGVLILISCDRGAYNFSDIAFVRRGGELEPARFDRLYAWGDARDVPLLVNTHWAQGELSTYAKGRGIGDCGTAERFAWDGEMFRLVERREMNQCRGSPHWIAVGRANAVRR